MNRIDKLFQTKKTEVLSIYFTAGYPRLDDTVTIVKELEKCGADMLEIGMPFSDPLADGPVIQQSSHKAIENGMSIKILLNQLKNIRNEVNIPLILMGYLNPVLQYGIEKFLKDVASIGIDGLILPDLPLSEFIEFKELFAKNNLHNIFLVTPQTSHNRILGIDKLSPGFIYMLSASSTTGTKTGMIEQNKEFFETVNRLGLISPTMIGFGISNHASFKQACNYANGAIIGTAFIKAVSKEGDLAMNIREFIGSIKGITTQPNLN